MRSALSSCRLYSWMRLTWQSKIVSGSTVWPDVGLSQSANCALASRLALRKASRKPLSSASGLSLRSWPRSVIQPSPMASVIASGERRVGQQQPAPRRDAVGLVVEALGKHLGEVLDRRRAQQLGVNRGHAVGAVRADDGQVGHADLALGAFLDQAHARDAALVAGEAVANLVEKAAVDLVDDLQVARQQHLEPGERPFLQRLGQQRVVRVGQRPLGEVPGLVPAEVRVVEQNAHQLGDRQRRVRVVELDGDLLGKRAPVGVAAPEAPHEVGQRAGDQEILLHEAQALPHARGVVGIEDARQRFGRQRLGQRADEIAAAEFLEVEVVGRGRGPEAERVDRLAAVADDRAIEGDADQGGRPAGDRAQAAAAQLERAVQLDLDLLVRAGDLPGVRAAEPVVRLLVLPAVLDRLPEDAVFVAQAVAHGRQLQRGHRVEEAGRQAAEPAVAQAGVGLLLEQLEPVEVLLLDGVAARTGSSSRFVTLLASERPMRNSIER